MKILRHALELPYRDRNDLRAEETPRRERQAPPLSTQKGVSGSRGLTGPFTVKNL
jgi:hypothetical protein